MCREAMAEFPQHPSRGGLGDRRAEIAVKKFSFLKSNCEYMCAAKAEFAVRSVPGGGERTLFIHTFEECFKKCMKDSE